MKEISAGVPILGNGELLTVYILLSAACALPSIIFMTILVTTIGHAFWYATPENEWQQLFWSKLPGWLVVKDRNVLSGYYGGESTLYTLSHIKAWLQPAIYWSIFVTCLIFVMLCINVILRKRWIQREHLAYPVIQIAYQLTCNTNRLFHSKRLFYSLIGITVLGSLAVFWVMLHLFYKVGASSGGGGGWSEGFGWRVFNGLQRWTYYPTEPNYHAMGGIAFGLLFSLMLTLMRARFIWWPFHPIGFVISSDWGMRYLWSCMLVSSVVKWGVLRFGERKPAQKLVMFAIGLMLGDFTVGGLWSLIGVFTKTPMYNFWP